MRFFSIFVFVALLSVVHGAQTGQPTATIEGIVLDSATNMPIEGVFVALSSTSASQSISETPAPAFATTDIHGSFSLRTKETGRFRVTVSKSGLISYGPGARTVLGLPGVWVQIGTDTHIQGLELKMARPGVITGRILDATGQPPSNSSLSSIVNLMHYTYDRNGKRKLAGVGIYGEHENSSQRANDRGEFRLYDLPPGEYYVAAGLGTTGTGADVSTGGFLYYPGVTDEANAVPIRVHSGDQISLGTLQLPIRPSTAALTLRITGTGGEGGVQLLAGANARPLWPDAPPLRALPGHYQIFAFTGNPLFQNLSYAMAEVDVSSADIVQELFMKPAPLVNGKILIENAAGERSNASPSIDCQLIDKLTGPSCRKSQVIPGNYQLDFQGLSDDSYVLSAKANGRDILADGLNVTTADIDMEIVLSAQGAIVSGVVRTNTGDLLPDASVVLVPDAPYRNTSLLYRSIVTDQNGKFEIHGVRPGAYKLFAWTELEGAAYRNSEFMKEFEERGIPLTIGKGARETVDLVAF